MNGASGGIVRIGFVPLIDAAPLVVAQELGLFDRHGVRVVLERQIGWANVRDKLTYGHLDAGHALLGMPLASALGADWAGEPLVSVMELGRGGNAITLSRALVDRGVRSAATLARWLHDRGQTRDALAKVGRADGADGGDGKPVFAHVFGCSTHHYLLREWLSAAGIDPDLDVRLCVVPPPQMAGHMHHGHLDGFCVGDPWNTLAERHGYGVVVTPTTDIVPNHPEKVLAVTRRWAADHGPAVVAIVKALLQACGWCDDPANHPRLAEMLSADRYVGLPAADLAASLRVDRTVGTKAGGVNLKQSSPEITDWRTADWRPADWRMRSFATAGTYPSATHAAWLAEQMIRWGHAPSDVDVVAAARRCTDGRFYREAAAGIGIACPDDAFPPMPLRHGAAYDARRSPYRGPQQVRTEDGSPAGDPAGSPPTALVAAP